METRKITPMKLIYNPFTRIAGLPALSFGTLFLIVGAMIAGFFNGRFDGVLDLHFGNSVGFIKPLSDQIIVWFTLVLVFFPLAYILGAKPRFIDMAGTLALSRIPYAIAPLANAGGLETRLSESLQTIDPKNFKLPFSNIELVLFILLSLLTIALLVWLVALYFNAYKTCTNLKGNKLIVSFIGGLIAAEALSIYLIRYVF